MTKRTAGILKDIEEAFGAEFLTELWHGVQFGKCSGITCCEIQESKDVLPDAGRDSASVCGDQIDVDRAGP